MKSKNPRLSKFFMTHMSPKLCHTDTLNVSINAFPVCNNEDCKTKVGTNSGTHVYCQSWNQSILLTNCYLNMNVSLQLEKESKCYSVPGFPEVLNYFLAEGTLYVQREDWHLSEKNPLRECVDLKLSLKGMNVDQTRQLKKNQRKPNLNIDSVLP